MRPVPQPLRGHCPAAMPCHVQAVHQGRASSLAAILAQRARCGAAIQSQSQSQPPRIDGADPPVHSTGQRGTSGRHTSRAFDGATRHIRPAHLPCIRRGNAAHLAGTAHSCNLCLPGSSCFSSQSPVPNRGAPTGAAQGSGHISARSPSYHARLQGSGGGAGAVRGRGGRRSQPQQGAGKSGSLPHTLATQRGGRAQDRASTAPAQACLPRHPRTRASP